MMSPKSTAQPYLETQAYLVDALLRGSGLVVENTIVVGKLRLRTGLPSIGSTLASFVSGPAAWYNRGRSYAQPPIEYKATIVVRKLLAAWPAGYLAGLLRVGIA